MSPKYFRPSEVHRQGLQAVHQRPFCANEDSRIVGRFDAETAWATFPKLELSPPHCHVAIVLDIDSTEGLDDAPGKSWWGGNPTPAPNWMVINTRPATPQRRAGGIHAVYALEVPVARHDAAHMLPLRYLAHVADRLSYHLGADPGYQGIITRNPVNPGPECFSHFSRMLPYSLRELDTAPTKGEAAVTPTDGHRAQCGLIQEHGLRSLPAKVGGHSGDPGMG